MLWEARGLATSICGAPSLGSSDLPRSSSALSAPLFRAFTSRCSPCSYEDPVALDGGEEGMGIITHILALAPRLLKDSGYG